MKVKVYKNYIDVLEIEIKHYDTFSSYATNSKVTLQKALRRLKIACETVKTELSSLQESIIDIDCLAQQEDFTITIKNAHFKSVSAPPKAFWQFNSYCSKKFLNHFFLFEF